jgi:hypothetical protein
MSYRLRHLTRATGGKHLPDGQKNILLRNTGHAYRRARLRAHQVLDLQTLANAIESHLAGGKPLLLIGQPQANNADTPAANTRC